MPVRPEPGPAHALEILRDLGRRIWANRLQIEFAALLVLIAIAVARYARNLFG